MRAVEVRKVYTVDTISKTNDRAWKTLREIMESENVRTLFDFEGIEVVEPWANEEFKRLMGNPNVHLKLYSSNKTAVTIDTMCKLAGYTHNRVVNEEVVSPKKPTKEEIKADQFSETLLDYFTLNGDTAVLEIHRRFDQIGSVNTVEYIELAINKYYERTGISNVVIDARDISIQKNILELLVGIINKCGTKGIKLELKSEDEDITKKVRLYQHIYKNKNITLEDKYRIAEDIIQDGDVGMLVKYRKSRTKDEFGRYGKGETISCRAAIFKGFTEDASGVKLNFTSFNGTTFYTKYHWAMENDNEQLENLNSEDLIISLSDIGVFDSFLGGRYHFIKPIQYDESGYTTMYSHEEGKQITIKATIPMRIKSVLDDWGIDYCNSSLIHAMTETERLLDKKKSKK